MPSWFHLSIVLRCFHIVSYFSCGQQQFVLLETSQVIRLGLQFCKLVGGHRRGHWAQESQIGTAPKTESGRGLGKGRERKVTVWGLSSLSYHLNRPKCRWWCRAYCLLMLFQFMPDDSMTDLTDSTCLLTATAQPCVFDYQRKRRVRPVVRGYWYVGYSRASTTELIEPRHRHLNSDRPPCYNTTSTAASF